MQLVPCQQSVVVAVERGEPPRHRGRDLGELQALVAVGVGEDERLRSLDAEIGWCRLRLRSRARGHEQRQREHAKASSRNPHPTAPA